ncbi:23S rRNA (adenine(2503)-C(2))-methyltransferase RlmN [Azospirillum brasilense]|uniref:Dual-specificity RNA methyltransferase RlmN n=1 Tax=Azospirillum brasilense TaxID=192 RepID=A0A0P0EJS9_AZOBR|nr:MULTISPECIES: 23S rRNA (adenine(2503)-C(2))-methyltransferase RlmN [Azospirillum]ALJ34172.1 23S rRNA (adenine(2503)-C2)-methyltransferase [Azospirillum brasilense]MDW7552846.1 23S rRNA (adenine(2503)-C(2))-methyltransferase RlmN [Azospirillum brasilense]MDW7591962.1 23S rRNA (adenine(2503)-C(2))-methyltransferase RlmN [Azospirillum brasilense]MDW7627761.1 23S rRNA (adenine(2503)-C(2))-methyltransferase RlmN [Azospirillum brasilense]MDX5952770.1 23S rRNA (adenine(2503)-C(2))-methyltransferas
MSASNHAAAFALPAVDADGRKNLVGLSRDELEAEMLSVGLEKFRARQLWHWIYHRGATDFAVMTTLAKPVRETLAESYAVARPTVVRDLKSVDGTRKWLLRMPDGQEVESVHIPEEDRGTLCVSSQVGCTLTCRFCHTGTQRLVRNLDASEIVAQVMLARDALGEWPAPPDGRMISNIVMMGMGEPLFNYENVAKALKIVMDGDGISISKRRITLSTSGVVPAMKRCGEELNVNLAVSLHAVTDELRDIIMPINRKYPLKELMDACRTYPGLNNARRITFEYVMLKGVNDSPADARALVKLLEGIPSKINLIPFNPWPGAPYERSTDRAIQVFGDIVNNAGYASPVRTTRGEDIMAACGQLKSASVRLSAADRAAIEKVLAEKDAALAG